MRGLLLVVVVVATTFSLVAAQGDIADASSSDTDNESDSPVLSSRLDSDTLSKWPIYNDHFIAAVNSVR